MVGTSFWHFTSCEHVAFFVLPFTLYPAAFTGCSIVALVCGWLEISIWSAASGSLIPKLKVNISSLKLHALDVAPDYMNRNKSILVRLFNGSSPIFEALTDFVMLFGSSPTCIAMRSGRSQNECALRAFYLLIMNEICQHRVPSRSTDFFFGMCRFAHAGVFVIHAWVQMSAFEYVLERAVAGSQKLVWTGLRSEAIKNRNKKQSWVELGEDSLIAFGRLPKLVSGNEHGRSMLLWVCRCFSYCQTKNPNHETITITEYEIYPTVGTHCLPSPIPVAIFSPFRKRMQCTFSFFWNKNYTFSESVFIFEAGCFVKTVSDEVKKENDIYFEEAYTFFQKKEFFTAFFFWMDFNWRQLVAWSPVNPNEN